MFAYFIKLQEQFDPSNSQKRLADANIRYLNPVKGRIIIAINKSIRFCFHRIVNLLIQVHNFITVCG